MPDKGLPVALCPFIQSTALRNGQQSPSPWPERDDGTVGHGHRPPGVAVMRQVVGSIEMPGEESVVGGNVEIGAERVVLHGVDGAAGR